MKDIFSLGDYTVRHTVSCDLPAIDTIYQGARERMHKGGNPTQWVNHPRLSLIEQDIREGNSYVITQGETVCGTFYFIIGDDETYHVIDDGAWLDDAPYGVIHRIAGDGIHRGILQTAVAFAQTKTDNIRIDTHENNKIMQHLLTKLGFSRCGIIYVKDDISDRSPRVAFQRHGA